LDERNSPTIEVRTYSGQTVLVRDARDNMTKYYYGAFDQLEAADTDSEQRRIELERDAYGRILRTWDPSRGSDDTVHEYNGLGELTRTEDPGGRVQEFFYDDFGRIDRVVDDEDEHETTSWTYGTDRAENNLGRLIRTESPTGQRTSYAYEPRGNGRNRGLLTEVTRRLIGPDGERTLTTNFEFDEHSRMEVVRYPSTTERRFAAKYHYDDFGHMIRVTDDNDEDRLFWELLESFRGFRVGTERLGNADCDDEEGTLTERRYDDGTFRLMEIESRCGEDVFQHLSYDYDYTGNVSLRTNHVTNDTEVLQYDTLNRVSLVNDVESFRYDDELGHFGLTYQAGIGTYEPQEETLSTEGNDYWTGNAGDNHYEHDTVGNTILRSGPTVPGASQTIEYTPFDLPRRVTRGDGAIVEFLYGASGDRLIKSSQVSSSNTYYAGDIYQRVESTAGQPAKNRNVVYAGNRAVAVVLNDDTETGFENPTLRFLHDDIVGSIHTITDADADVDAARDYGLFGVQEANSPHYGDVPIGFTGHEEDRDLGLINMKGRMYDPYQGQFLTPDPATQFAAGHGFNGFSYVLNAPLNYTDPSGFTAINNQDSQMAIALGSWTAGVVGIPACMAYCGTAISAIGNGIQTGASALGDALTSAGTATADAAKSVVQTLSDIGGGAAVPISGINVIISTQTPPVHSEPVKMSGGPSGSDSPVTPGNTSGTDWARNQEGALIWPDPPADGDPWGQVFGFEPPPDLRPDPPPPPMEGLVELPGSGPGYVAVSPDRFGTPELVEILVETARIWQQTARPGISRTLRIGDLSKREGGGFGQHRSHAEGLDADISVIVEDGPEPQSWPSDRKVPNYSQEGTQELVNILEHVGGGRIKLILGAKELGINRVGHFHYDFPKSEHFNHIHLKLHP
jgi:RHS repeat-associated protein